LPLYEIVLRTLPEWIILIFALAALLIDLAATRVRRLALTGTLIAQPVYTPWLPNLALAGLLLAALSTLLIPTEAAGLFNGMYATDTAATFFKLVVLVAVALIVVIAHEFMANKPFAGEFYSLLLFCTLAILLTISANDLLMIFLAVEFLSLTSYILTGYLRHDQKSSEAALKYFLFGALTSATMLYGMSLLYGLTGTTRLGEIAALVTSDYVSNGTRLVLVPMLVLLLTGLGFKIAAVPFHQWTPDVYEGAPTPVTAFLAVAPKVAGFAVIVRVFLVAFPALSNEWAMLLAIISALSMTWGNLVAIPQTNLKRLFAYSSIAQMGYVLIGLAAIGPDRYGLIGILIYLLGYIFTNTGAFVLIIAVEQATGSVEVNAYRGLASRAPLLAVLFLIFFLSLVGIPGTAGFIGKFFVFGAAIRVNLLWLAIVGIINSVISVYYYFNVVRQMFFLPAETNARPVVETPLLRFAMLVCAFMTLVIGLYPQPFIELVQASTWLLLR